MVTIWSRKINDKRQLGLLGKSLTLTVAQQSLLFGSVFFWIFERINIFSYPVIRILIQSSAAAVKWQSFSKFTGALILIGSHSEYPSKSINKKAISVAEKRFRTHSYYYFPSGLSTG